MSVSGQSSTHTILDFKVEELSLSEGDRALRGKLGGASQFGKSPSSPNPFSLLGRGI
jgi:hypothetical protein